MYLDIYKWVTKNHIVAMIATKLCYYYLLHCFVFASLFSVYSKIKFFNYLKNL